MRSALKQQLERIAQAIDQQLAMAEAARGHALQMEAVSKANTMLAESAQLRI